MSLPLFSPLQASQISNLPDGGVVSPEGDAGQPERESLAIKAKEQYEAWLQKKTEREGGIGEEDDGYGTKEWVPKERIVARPGATEGLAHSDGYGDRRFQEPVVDSKFGKQNYGGDLAWNGSLTPYDPSAMGQYGMGFYNPYLANDPMLGHPGMWDGQQQLYWNQMDPSAIDQSRFQDIGNENSDAQ